MVRVNRSSIALDLRVPVSEEGPTLALRVRARSTNVTVAGIALLLGAVLIGHFVAESVAESGV